jgi:hypothetical protein
LPPGVGHPARVEIVTENVIDERDPLRGFGAPFQRQGRAISNQLHLGARRVVGLDQLVEDRAKLVSRRIAADRPDLVADRRGAEVDGRSGREDARRRRRAAFHRHGRQLAGLRQFGRFGDQREQRVEVHSRRPLGGIEFGLGNRRQHASRQGVDPGLGRRPLARADGIEHAAIVARHRDELLWRHDRGRLGSEIGWRALRGKRRWRDHGQQGDKPELHASSSINNNRSFHASGLSKGR